MRFLRILPAVWPRISWPFSSSTRNIALGSNSTTRPRISRSSSLAIQILVMLKFNLAANSRRAFQRKGGAGRQESIDGEDRRAGSFAALKRAVRLGRVGEGEALPDIDFHLASSDCFE